MPTPIFEYRYAHFLLDINELGGLNTPEQIEKLDDLLNSLGIDLTKYLMNWEGGRFEAISHGFVVIGNKLLATVLTRRLIGEQHMTTQPPEA